MICAREYAMGGAMNKGYMDFDLFRHFIDENYYYLDRVGLTGLGETLLYPKIVDAVKYIRSKSRGIGIFISTNAYQANAVGLIDRIADDIDTLQISLDGIGSTFESIRIKSKFNRYEQNVEALAKMAAGRRMTVKFNMVVFDRNAHQMSEVVNLAERVGVEEVYFNTFNLVANDLDLKLYDFYREPEFRKILAEVKSIARDKNIYVTMPEVDAPKGFRHCGYPWDDFYITWEGFLAPCCAKPFPKEKNFGNVFRQGLMSSLNSPDFIEFRKFSNRNITPDFCQRCHKIC
jgi:MoaA/NifB/PqqE/SkfB family radical SAM enzyme